MAETETHTPKKLNVDLDNASNKAFSIDPNKMRVVRINPSLISGDPDQPRKFFDKAKLDELAESISSTGMIQPIHVRVDPKDRDRYLVVAGERRLRACKQLERDEIDAIVLTEKIEQIQLIENIQREDLTPLEEANAYKRYQNQFDLTQEQLSAHVGKKRSTIVEILSITSLPEEIQMRLDDYPHVSKSQLILMAKEKDPVKLDKLWFQAKQGVLTVQDARAVRKGEKAPSTLSPTETALKAVNGAKKKLSKLESLTESDVIEVKKHLKEINKILKEKVQ